MREILGRPSLTFFAFSQSVTADVVYAVIEELNYRRGLKIALAHRDEITLEPVARFVVRNITNPRYSSLLIDVANALLDAYGGVIGQGTVLDELFARLRSKVARELWYQRELLQVLGSLDMVLSNAVLSSQ